MWLDFFSSGTFWSRSSFLTKAVIEVSFPYLVRVGTGGISSSLLAKHQNQTTIFTVSYSRCEEDKDLCSRNWSSITNRTIDKKQNNLCFHFDNGVILNYRNQDDVKTVYKRAKDLLGSQILHLRVSPKLELSRVILAFRLTSSSLWIGCYNGHVEDIVIWKMAGFMVHLIRCIVASWKEQRIIEKIIMHDDSFGS